MKYRQRRTHHTRNRPGFTHQGLRFHSPNVKSLPSPFLPLLLPSAVPEPVTNREKSPKIRHTPPRILKMSRREIWARSSEAMIACVSASESEIMESLSDEEDGWFRAWRARRLEEAGCWEEGDGAIGR